MTYPIISKAQAIGLLLAFVGSSVAFSDQGLDGQKAVQDHDEISVITEDQQRRWEMKMLSWQQNLAYDLQKNVVNTLLLKHNIDHQQDFSVFPAELPSDRDSIVQK